MKYLIIGGGSGIGRAIAQSLVDQGHEVHTTSRRGEEADMPEGVKVQAYDVLEAGDLEVPDELNGLVYCPGSIDLKPFDRIAPEKFKEELEINFIGAISVIQKCIKPLKSGKGSVVLFSTVAVQTGLPYHSAIASAKGAVEGLTRSLAAEYAPHVRFNAIAPSLTDTPMAEGLLNNEKKQEANAARHPLKRVGTPADIAQAAHYLLQADNWISGQVLHVDGGIGALRPL